MPSTVKQTNRQTTNVKVNVTVPKPRPRRRRPRARSALGGGAAPIVNSNVVVLGPPGPNIARQASAAIPNNSFMSEPDVSVGPSPMESAAARSMPLMKPVETALSRRLSQMSDFVQNGLADERDAIDAMAPLNPGLAEAMRRHSDAAASVISGTIRNSWPGSIPMPPSMRPPTAPQPPPETPAGPQVQAGPAGMQAPGPQQAPQDQLDMGMVSAWLDNQRTLYRYYRGRSSDGGSGDVGGNGGGNGDTKDWNSWAKKWYDVLDRRELENSIGMPINPPNAPDDVQPSAPPMPSPEAPVEVPTAPADVLRKTLQGRVTKPTRSGGSLDERREERRQGMRANIEEDLRRVFEGAERAPIAPAPIAPAPVPPAVLRRTISGRVTKVKGSREEKPAKNMKPDLQPVIEGSSRSSSWNKDADAELRAIQNMVGVNPNNENIAITVQDTKMRKEGVARAKALARRHGLTFNKNAGLVTVMKMLQAQQQASRPNGRK